jgi:acetoin utilization deacetylase AcuC-like enzyme
MKPYRVRLTHELLVALALDKKLTPLPPSRLTTSEMSKFHTDE